MHFCEKSSGQWPMWSRAQVGLGPKRPWALVGPSGPGAQVGPGRKWAQVGPRAKVGLGLKRARAQLSQGSVGPDPSAPRAQVGPRPKWATPTTAAATAAAEEFYQSMQQAPSSTHPGTTYTVRDICHSDVGNYVGNYCKHMCYGLPCQINYSTNFIH
jgi:hypothetical protein